MFARIPPTQLSQPVAKITGLHRPASLCFSEGSVLASEMGLSRIMKLTPGATASTSARHILLELPGVTEITVDPQSGALYATTTEERHQVCKFTKSGELTKMIGSLGSLPGQFNFPNEGVTVDEDGYVYVTSHQSKVLILF